MLTGRIYLLNICRNKTVKHKIAFTAYMLNISVTEKKLLGADMKLGNKICGSLNF